jgi:hypothetical protein
MKYAVLVLMIGMATACSSDPSKPAANSNVAQVDDPSKGIICTEDAPTGSVLKKKRCTTPEQREAARRQEETLDVQRSRGDAR